jgi:small subunit ribosomal protein S6
LRKKIYFLENTYICSPFKKFTLFDMNQYEVTFIVDPVLSGDEIVATAQTYVDHLQGEGCKIVHVEEMGLRQLAYPLNKRTTGVYFCIEYSSEKGSINEKMELAFRRDERIIRFLTVKLDKYGVKYNDDKRKGLIGRKKTEKVAAAEETKSPAPAKQKEVVAEEKAAAPVAATAPVAVEVPAVEAAKANGSSEEE